MALQHEPELSELETEPEPWQRRTRQASARKPVRECSKASPASECSKATPCAPPCGPPALAIRHSKTRSTAVFTAIPQRIFKDTVQVERWVAHGLPVLLHSWRERGVLQ
eukprot:COSAG04_NODE_9707_length_838_cov_1.384303_1_plen_108_part_10